MAVVAASVAACGGMMFGGINLTDDQKAKMKQIGQSFRERTSRCMRNSAPSGRSCVRQARAVRSTKHWPLRNCRSRLACRRN